MSNEIVTFPCPNLDQLKYQAKDLLRSIRSGDPSAIEEFNEYHPKPVAPDQVTIANAFIATRAASLSEALEKATITVDRALNASDATSSVATAPRHFFCCKKSCDERFS
ncbi:MAG: hypothetical protein ACR2G5_18450 [Pyrinomonadaceae bacterium]